MQQRGAGVCFSKGKRSAGRVDRKQKQYPRDGVCGQRVRCKEDRVGATVMTLVRCAVTNHFVSASVAVVYRKIFMLRVAITTVQLWYVSV